VRTWHLVPVGLATGLAGLVAVAGAGVGVSATADDPKPVPTPTVTVTETVTATPKPKATHKAKRKRKAKPKPTATPTVTRSPRATRSTTRPPVSGSPQAVARALLSARGWSAQWSAFNALEMGEAGWNPRALNPSSGACGLPQALPCSKLPNGINSTVTQQVTWMLDYIARNYGSPAKAYAAWLSRSPHWY
jgi:hypothetical protein